MKHFVLFVLLTITISVVLACNVGRNGFTSPPAYAAESGPGGTVGVDQLMKNVDKHRGSVSVEGVVSAVSPRDHTISLIDTQEFKKCAVVTCATLTLPVRWSGTMPSVKNQVRIEGEIKENKGKLIFQAKTLEGADSQSGGSK